MADEPGIYAFFGTDHLRVRENAAEMVARLTPPEAGEFGLEIVDGVADNTDGAVRICADAIAAIQTLPFFGGGKVIWLKGATFLGDDQTGKSERTKEAAANLGEVLAEGLGPEISFVISASAVDKRKSFYKTVTKVATQVEVFDKIDISKDGWEEQAMAEVGRRAKEIDLAFAPGALEAFVLRAGEDTAQANNELEKLSLYLGPDKEVTEEVIREMVSPTRHGVIFDIGNAIARRDLPGALSLVKLLLGQGESAVGILLAAIVPKVRNLFWARVLGQATGTGPRASYGSFQSALNSLPPGQTAHLPRTKKDNKFNAYPIYLSLREASAFSGKHLRTSLGACLKANRTLVTSSTDHEVVLTRLLVEILAPE